VVAEKANSGGGAMKLLVLGGGMAGLAMALAAGRGGHEVVLVERDTDSPAGDAAEVFEGWQRTGVAQFRQPHNFLGLGRRLLRDRAPDVYRELLAAGAVEVEQFRFLTGAAPEPGDEDLATISCRRPVFEAALRRAVEAEPAIDLRSGCRVTGLVLSGGRSAHVEGVVLAGGEVLGRPGRGRLRPQQPHDGLASGGWAGTGRRAQLRLWTRLLQSPLPAP
jgi:2-polyprenyl-6-methoxyphenol hydroxylase-like FAD-dependent oxidoreductase